MIEFLRRNNKYRYKVMIKKKIITKQGVGANPSS